MVPDKQSYILCQLLITELPLFSDYHHYSIISIKLELVQRCVRFVIRYICWLQFDPLLAESLQPETCVLMLESPEDDVVIKAAEAIYKFVEKCKLFYLIFC